MIVSVGADAWHANVSRRQTLPLATRTRTRTTTTTSAVDRHCCWHVHGEATGGCAPGTKILIAARRTAGLSFLVLFLFLLVPFPSCFAPSAPSAPSRHCRCIFLTFSPFSCFALFRVL